MATESRPTMRVNEAAVALGVHANTIRNWIREDLLEAHTLPSGIRRPYVDSVLANIIEVDVEGVRRLLTAKANRLEQQATALRAALAALPGVD